MATEPRAASPRQLVLNHENRRLEGRFLWALRLTVVVLVAEVAGGLWTHSLRSAAMPLRACSSPCSRFPSGFPRPDPARA